MIVSARGYLRVSVCIIDSGREAISEILVNVTWEPKMEIPGGGTLC